MSKNKESQLVVGSNEHVTASSLLTLHGSNIEDYKKQYIVTNIEFEGISTSIKSASFLRVCLILSINWSQAIKKSY